MTIAVLGTGLMGFPMARRLCEAGHTVYAYNRTLAKAEPLTQFGAQVVASAQEAVAACDYIILVLTDAAAITDVLSLDKSPVYKGKVIIQMGTIAPAESVAIGKQINACGGEYLEAPVLGSRAEAAGGKLIVMAGGKKALFQRTEPVLQIFGARPHYIGDIGKAASLKLALNHLIACHAVGFSLSLGIIEKNGVDETIFMDILKSSALHAPMFEKKYVNWHERKYENPNFSVKHLLKDVSLVWAEAKEKNLSTDVIDGIRDILNQTVDQGLGEKDYSAVFNIINKVQGPVMEGQD